MKIDRSHESRVAALTFILLSVIILLFSIILRTPELLQTLAFLALIFGSQALVVSWLGDVQRAVITQKKTAKDIVLFRKWWPARRTHLRSFEFVAAVLAVICLVAALALMLYGADRSTVVHVGGGCPFFIIAALTAARIHRKADSVSALMEEHAIGRSGEGHEAQT